MWEEIAKIIGGGGVMDQLPNERQGVRPGFGLEGASVRGSDIHDQLRNAERKEAMMPTGGGKNWQLGFPKTGQSKPFAQQKYSVEVPVRVTWPDGMVHEDVVKGLNRAQALKRAQFNWEGAKVDLIE